MKTIITSLGLLFLMNLSLYSQQESYSNYSSLEYNQFIIDQNFSEIEKEFRAKETARFYNNRISKEDPTNRKIPIVFHIIGSREDISTGNVLAQLDALNRDFSLRKIITNHSNDISSRFRSAAKSTLIEFCLAQYNESGRSTNGVEYVSSKKPVFDDYVSMKTADEGAEPWDQDKYLNIWVCKLDPMNKGFAQFPSGPKDFDGIVINADYFGIQSQGKGYDRGSTLTHLVGNYLGLYPLWGSNPCQDDYVEDTPVHNMPNYGTSHISHVSTCESVGQEMTMNFMDNTFDDTKYMFTKGQMLRMQATLSQGGDRNELLSTATQCDGVDLKEAIAETREREDEEIIMENDLVQINPNPARDYIDISYNVNKLGSCNLNIISAEGRKVMSNTVSGNTRLDVSELPEGNYFLHFVSSANTIVKKLIKH